MPTADAVCRLLIEPEPHDGRWNMAYDEALLEAAATRGDVILRIYRWSEPTLSLGYFQKSLPADLPPSLRSLPCVRRLSGGGAILHHHEWTYSCAVPKGHPFTKRAETLYEEAHRSLIHSFARHGVLSAMRGEATEVRAEPFLCFLRGDPRDVVVSGHKVVGSAQRRRRGAILQHGSVLLKVSPLAPSVPGILDLVRNLDDDPLLGVKSFCSDFGRRLFPQEPIFQPHPSDLDNARGQVVSQRPI